ncbi:MAG: PhoH family protein [Campylobacterales bacterium]
MNHLYIVDTSVILDNAYNIFLLSNDGANRVIIPETVLDEIDAKKSGYDDINFQAREFNRILEEQGNTYEQIDLDIHGDKLSVVKVTIGRAVFELVSKKDYKVLSSKDASNIINDRKILEIAQYFPECEVISNDSAMRIRARSLKLKASPLRTNRVSDIDELSFVEVVTIKEAQKEHIQGSRPQDWGLNFSFFTNIEFVVEETGEHILAFYKPTGIEIINEERLRRLIVKPRNKEQIFFLNMLIDKDVPIVVCAGVTGSGKNLLSMQGAIALLNDHESGIDQIIYCRNTVTAGDTAAQLGFLKGDEWAKLSVFTYPLYDAVAAYQKMEFDERLKQGKSAPVLSTEEFMAKNNIKPININQMRGTNLNGYMIFDEWQNASAMVNKLMLTRVVEGSKVVILGDLNQIDHPHLSRYNNALAIMLKHAQTSNLIGAIKMTKVMRGRIAEFADREL